MKKKKIQTGQIVLNVFFSLLSLCYVIPLMLLVSISLDGSSDHMFRVFPKEITLKAYELIFEDATKIFRAYGVTIFSSVTGVLLSLFVMTMFAYALSRPNFKLRNPLSFMLFFTTLFGGGMVPTYLVYSSFLHIDNTLWIYIIPAITNAWNIIVIRTYLSGLPQDLFESARLDGASEFRICFQIVTPLSTPVLASVGFLRFIDAWNNWMTSQVYMRRSPKLVTLQYLLKQILDNIEYLERMVNEGKADASMLAELSNMETMRFAMAVVGAGPAMLIFPFFQKYFAKGMVIGAVKG